MWGPRTFRRVTVRSAQSGRSSLNGEFPARDYAGTRRKRQCGLYAGERSKGAHLLTPHHPHVGQDSVVATQGESWPTHGEASLSVGLL